MKYRATTRIPMGKNKKPAEIIGVVGTQRVWNNHRYDGVEVWIYYFPKCHMVQCNYAYYPYDDTGYVILAKSNEVLIPMKQTTIVSLVKAYLKEGRTAEKE